MKRNKILSLILSLALIVSVFAFVPVDTHAVAATGTVFLMGGAVDDNNSELYNALKTAAGGGTPKIAVLCSAAADLATAQDAFYNDFTDTAGKVHLSYQHLFQKYGFNPVFIPIALNTYTTEAYSQTNITALSTANVVFFNGGDQAKHARCLLKDDGTDTPLMTAVRAVYNRNGVIAGTSAGTAVQGDPMYGEGISIGYLFHNKMAIKKITDVSLKDTSDTHDHNGGLCKGFGFMSPYAAIVDTHFDARGRLGRMIVAMRETKKTTAIGVDENTAFSVKGDIGKVYGPNGVFIADSSAATFGTATYFTANNVLVSYLTSGDSYAFNTKTVTSTKSTISPYYSTCVDSSDIFAPYETTYVMTRLIDSRDSYAYGDTTDPDGYISTMFTLKFQKTTSTKGYYSSGKYTISKMRVDITY